VIKHQKNFKFLMFDCKTVAVCHFETLFYAFGGLEEVVKSVKRLNSGKPCYGLSAQGQIFERSSCSWPICSFPAI
jgi:hypothetical protein